MKGVLRLDMTGYGEAPWGYHKELAQDMHCTLAAVGQGSNPAGESDCPAPHGPTLTTERECAKMKLLLAAMKEFIGPLIWWVFGVLFLIADCGPELITCFATTVILCEIRRNR